MNKYVANIVYFSLITNLSFTFFQKHTKSAPLNVTREGRDVRFGENWLFLKQMWDKLVETTAPGEPLVGGTLRLV